MAKKDNNKECPSCGKGQVKERGGICLVCLTGIPRGSFFEETEIRADPDRIGYNRLHPVQDEEDPFYKGSEWFPSENHLLDEVEEEEEEEEE